MIILLHTSKTMRPPAKCASKFDRPVLLRKTELLAEYLKTLTQKDIEKVMQISPKLASVTKDLIAGWTSDKDMQRPAIDSFLGDIYSGLQASEWTDEQRSYANKTLKILSGLYGVLRPLDGIYPYRLEMGYKLPDRDFSNLYMFWGEDIADTFPKDSLVVNLAALEYSKSVIPYFHGQKIISPNFLTVSPKTGIPTFVVVHAKIARGAYAHWLIKSQADSIGNLKDFNELGYEYDPKLSTSHAPAFVCKNFGGIGLSVRLT